MSGQQQLLLGTGVSAAANYIEDVFSTWLYTGNGSTQTITNGIDLSTKGGLVWTKARSSALNHFLCDTVRGRDYYLISDATVAQQGPSPAGRDISSFNSNGYSLGINANADINTNAVTFASWTFRKQPKFFDVVTWTGDGNTSKTISHSLGSVPGCIITKSTSGVNNWQTYHRSLGNTQAVQLNLTNAASTNTGFWNNTSPTSTQFTVGTVENANGETYVAYLFAHDAGGFGLTGTDNVISCGSFTTDGSGTATVNLGYEPQWLLWKRTDDTSNWLLLDNMRGWDASGSDSLLRPNSSTAQSSGNYGFPTATGFYMANMIASATYIYIAIRRGPMKTPTTGTSVFSPVARTGTGAAASVTAGFAPDIGISAYRTSGEYMPVVDKLRGPIDWLTWQQSITSAESNGYSGEWFTAFTNTGVTVGADNSGGKSVNSSGGSLIQYYFQRAPSFCDVTCYTGDGSTTQFVYHNLGVKPELVIQKRRNSSGAWYTAYAVDGSVDKTLLLNSTAATGQTQAVLYTLTNAIGAFDSTAGTINGATYVAYLFASCPGVSKVGTYTGTGALQTINCGFTGGARFVLIKRTDSTGGWYIYDSARGISSGNDPYLLINATAAEVTGTNYVDTTSVGFQVTAAAPAELNANGGTYLFLAIA